MKYLKNRLIVLMLQLLMLVKYTYIAQNNMKLANQHYLHK